MAEQLYMLSTYDNPFDPSTQFKEWYAYDLQSGYHSSSLLARLTRSSYELSEKDQEFAIQVAIDEIVSNDELGIYVKVPIKSQNN